MYYVIIYTYINSFLNVSVKLGQPIRLMLEYVGEDYEDKLLVKTEEWTSVKYEMGLDFPNLPYYIDGSVKLSQTMAILRYLGNKHGLTPAKGEEMTRADLAAEQVTDLRNRFVMLCYGDDFVSLFFSFTSSQNDIL